jgi:hypothetical protein
MRCARCNGTTRLIVEGPNTVCWGCVYALGDIVDNPDEADDRVLTALVAQHPGVRLERAKDRRLRWVPA